MKQVNYVINIFDFTFSSCNRWRLSILYIFFCIFKKDSILPMIFNWHLIVVSLMETFFSLIFYADFHLRLFQLHCGSVLCQGIESDCTGCSPALGWSKDNCSKPIIGLTATSCLPARWLIEMSILRVCIRQRVGVFSSSTLQSQHFHTSTISGVI